MADTELELSDGAHVARYSARDVTQTYEPDYDPVQERDVNGALIDLTPTQLKKLRTTIEGEDVEPPAFAHLRRGDVLSVRWAVRVAGEPGAPFATTEDSITVEGTTYYRPHIDMMVESFRVDTEEWQARSRWTLALRQV